MKKLLYTLFAFSFISCANERSISIQSGETSERVLYGAPVPIGNSPFIIIPLKIIDKNDIADAYYSADNNFAQVTDDCENLIFHDKKNKSNHLLSTKGFGRLSFHFIENEFVEASAKSKRFILYKIVKNDTNKDGQFDWSDASILYISEENGKKFFPVTPDNTRLVDWIVEFGTPNIFVRYLIDTDNNGVYDLNDEMRIIQLNLSEYYKKSKTPDEYSIVKPEEMKIFEEMLLKKEK